MFFKPGASNRPVEVRTSQKDQPEVRRVQMEIDRTNNRVRVCVCVSVCVRVCVCSAASLSVISCGQQVEGCVSDKQQVCPPGGQQL